MDAAVASHPDSGTTGCAFSAFFHHSMLITTTFFCCPVNSLHQSRFWGLAGLCLGTCVVILGTSP
ncbi:hypothetical protein H4582DRAFT_1956769 [Lactarius indigo]|nr:hypothetical protein H4582DRAFT_1956769 [Lactarius indigo]